VSSQAVVSQGVPEPQPTLNQTLALTSLWTTKSTIRPGPESPSYRAASIPAKRPYSAGSSGAQKISMPGDVLPGSVPRAQASPTVPAAARRRQLGHRVGKRGHCACAASVVSPRAGTLTRNFWNSVVVCRHRAEAGHDVAGI
jgi:hypothetical protein